MKNQVSKVKAGRAIASWFIPPVGIVTYFMIRDQQPKKARAYLFISLASIAVHTASAIIYYATKDKN